MPDITIADLTTKEIDGTGAFDVLMQALEKHLKREHEANRFTGDQYAAIYTQLTSTVLQQAIAFLLGNEKLRVEVALAELQQGKVEKEIQLLCQKLVTEKAQVMNETVLDPTATEETSGTGLNGSLHNTVNIVEGVTGRKNSVLARQEKGYDDDYKTKTARVVLDTYKIVVSNSAEGTSFPVNIQDAGIDNIIDGLKVDSGLGNEVGGVFPIP